MTASSWVPIFSLYQLSSFLDQVQCLRCDESLIKIAASTPSGIRSNNETAAVYLPKV